MISDDQVRCAPKNKTTIHWLKPSTINGSFEKLLIVPISSTKYLAVESIRPYGYSFKIPKCQLGALVYVISNWGTNKEKTIQIPTKTKKDSCLHNIYKMQQWKPIHLEINYAIKTGIFLFLPQEISYPTFFKLSDVILGWSTILAMYETISFHSVFNPFT
jgi:hypothetical protein